MLIKKTRVNFMHGNLTFEKFALKLKLYCSHGRLERSVFRQLVVLNSLPRLVLASFVVLLACLLLLNLDGTDKIYNAHFYRISDRLCKPQFVSIYWPLPWRTMTCIVKVSFWRQYQRCPFLSLQFFTLYREVDSLWIIFRFTTSATLKRIKSL